MQNRFEKGNKVVCVDRGGCHTITHGGIYEVLYPTGFTHLIHIRNNRGDVICVKNSRFKLHEAKTKTKTTTFERAEIGDKVYDYILGWGFIHDINHSRGSNYPIKATFNLNVRSYTTEGYSYLGAKNPSLFWNKPTFVEIPAQPDKPKYQVAYKVYKEWIISSEKYSSLGHFAAVNPSIGNRAKMYLLEEE